MIIMIITINKNNDYYYCQTGSPYSGVTSNAPPQLPINVGTDTGGLCSVTRPRWKTDPKYPDCTHTPCETEPTSKGENSKKR